jgi:nucleoside-diphosphate-sugar epimerase
MISSGKILLVGGAGYVGSVITARLLTEGYSVRCLDLLIYGDSIEQHSYASHERFEFIKGDFTRPDVIQNALHGISDVVILAGLVGDPITKKYPEASEAINTKGILDLLAMLALSDLRRVVFISTCSNYGLVVGDQSVSETSALNPLSLYAKSKVDIERALLSYKGRVSWSATVLRFATAFGYSPRMRFDLTVNEFARELFFGRELLVYDPDTWRPYCHVQDFATVVSLTLNAPQEKVNFEVFNAGGDVNNCTKKMIIDKIIPFVQEPKVAYKQHGADPRNYKVSFEKILRTLGFEPRYKVEDGIRELVTAFKKGEFSNFSNRNAYGNYELEYSAPR